MLCLNKETNKKKKGDCCTKCIFVLGDLEAGLEENRAMLLSGNKYRGGTSDATTSSSLIVPLFIMSVDDFSPSKTAVFGVRK